MMPLPALSAAKADSSGIALTGHKFVATDSLTNNNSKNNVKGTLEKNITFFKNQPFELLWNLTSGRKYNNYTRENFNDIMLVSIPENDLNNNKEDIIIQNDSSLYLNPSYIKGYAKINTVDGDIKDIKENPRFINKNYHELYNQRESNYDYRQKLDQWYKDINTTKFGKIFSKVKGIFSKNQGFFLKNERHAPLSGPPPAPPGRSPPASPPRSCLRSVP